MEIPSKILENAVHEISKLPGIGRSTALRLALNILSREESEKIIANADQEILDRREQILDEELDKFLNGINTSNYRSKTDTWMGL